jgi:hypothetical protein
VVDEETPDTNHNMYPIEHKRRRNRARYAAMSLLQREAINKKRRDTRVAKCLFKTPQDKEIRRQQQRDYKKRLKNTVTTTCILTPLPWQTLNGNHNFYSLLVISLPQEYRKRWSSPISVAALSMSRSLYGNLHSKMEPRRHFYPTLSIQPT